MHRRSFIKKSALISAASTLPFGIGIGCRRHYEFDTIIHSGMLFDGRKAEPVRSDLGIKDGKIVAIGMLKGKSCRREIDAANLAVAPGFIDIHGHSDDDLLIDGRALSKIHDGVTTEVVGQDGGSMAPLNEKMLEARSDHYMKRYQLDAMWTDFTGYFDVLRRKGISMNMLSMVGAGTLRNIVIGMENRKATPEELEQMRTLFSKALQQGARHISTGLEYTPGSFASTDELADLVSVMDRNGVYATHMRNEDDQVLDAIEEAIAIAEKAGVKLHIAHIKIQGARNWHKLQNALSLLDAARERGLSVTCDRYPYIAYSTGLTNLFPIWSREGGSTAFVERLQNPGLRNQIRSAVDEKIASLGSWNAVQFSSLGKNSRWIGKKLGDMAKETGKTPFNFLLDLMIDEGGRGGMVGFGMSEENTEAILRYPYTVVASDGSALAEEGPLAKGNPHPRNYGTFARVLGHYVREKKSFSLSEAIRKMTSLPAEIIGLQNRGRLVAGNWADITIFDPDKVQDNATFEKPKKFSSGFHFVLVNGVVVLENDEHLGEKPGVVL